MLAKVEIFRNTKDFLIPGIDCPSGIFRLFLSKPYLAQFKKKNWVLNGIQICICLTV